MSNINLINYSYLTNIKNLNEKILGVPLIKIFISESTTSSFLFFIYERGLIMFDDVLVHDQVLH